MLISGDQGLKRRIRQSNGLVLKRPQQPVSVDSITSERKTRGPEMRQQRKMTKLIKKKLTNK